MYCNIIATLVRKSLILFRKVYAEGIVSGGGRFETNFSHHLKNFAQQQQNQLGVVKMAAIDKFAEALLIIPTTLSKNSKNTKSDIILDAAVAKTNMISLAIDNTIDLLAPKLITTQVTTSITTLKKRPTFKVPFATNKPAHDELDTLLPKQSTTPNKIQSESPRKKQLGMRLRSSPYVHKNDSNTEIIQQPSLTKTTTSTITSTITSIADDKGDESSSEQSSKAINKSPSMTDASAKIELSAESLEHQVDLQSNKEPTLSPTYLEPSHAKKPKMDVKLDAENADKSPPTNLSYENQPKICLRCGKHFPDSSSLINHRTIVHQKIK